ncbi:hypothetical protein CHLNCDRAFT_145121 [Chlorella variabilis]|uniref:Uncharacterized protein n=1 Tax=Chlorella variabilis TaxID=554065 RepID=E1ZCM3_CHLVA|nr:hypothetical protein CHLNCDRAFT_145121 [Chlorella variabilis]EFN56267.1 hypothetical protein CHLNCDRAFT_145121 [Chlorella variabilis]|eukprot:XP_005848369.1 hypothetical protein CHLNCDRAFT_145121 [Chlorella variabilis]
MSAPTPPPLTVRVWPHTQCTWLLGLAASGALALAAPQQAALPLLPSPAASIGARLALGAPLLAASLYCNIATRELEKAGAGGHVCVCAAWAVLLNSRWPLVMLVPWLAHVQLAMVPKEEEVLAALFPEEREQYRRDVPRWIPRLW